MCYLAIGRISWTEFPADCRRSSAQFSGSAWSRQEFARFACRYRALDPLGALPSGWQLIGPNQSCAESKTLARPNCEPQSAAFRCALHITMQEDLIHDECSPQFDSGRLSQQACGLSLISASVLAPTWGSQGRTGDSAASSPAATALNGPSVVLQCDHRVDSGRAPGGTGRRDQGGSKEHDGDEHQCQRIQWPHAEEQRAQPTDRHGRD